MSIRNQALEKTNSSWCSLLDHTISKGYFRPNLSKILTLSRMLLVLRNKNYFLMVPSSISVSI